MQHESLRPQTPFPAVPHRRHVRKFVEYFQILKSGDRPGWERAFDEIWHPEAIVHGRSAASLKDWHRTWVRSGKVENVHVLRVLDPERIEYATEAEGRYAGPFIATFRDGRVYRVL
jgi:hypothetical protein